MGKDKRGKSKELDEKLPPGESATLQLPRKRGIRERLKGGQEGLSLG